MNSALQREILKPLHNNILTQISRRVKNKSLATQALNLTIRQETKLVTPYFEYITVWNKNDGQPTKNLIHSEHVLLESLLLSEDLIAYIAKESNELSIYSISEQAIKTTLSLNYPNDSYKLMKLNDEELLIWDSDRIVKYNFINGDKGMRWFISNIRDITIVDKENLLITTHKGTKILSSVDIQTDIPKRYKAGEVDKFETFKTAHISNTHSVTTAKKGDKYSYLFVSLDSFVLDKTLDVDMKLEDFNFIELDSNHLLAYDESQILTLEKSTFNVVDKIQVSEKYKVKHLTKIDQDRFIFYSPINFALVIVDLRTKSTNEILSGIPIVSRILKRNLNEVVIQTDHSIRITNISDNGDGRLGLIKTEGPVHGVIELEANLVASYNGTNIQVWSTITGEKLCETPAALKIKGAEQAEEDFEFRTMIKLTPNILAFGDNQGKVTLWNYFTNSTLSKLDVHDGPIISITRSSGCIVSCCENKNLKITKKDGSHTIFSDELVQDTVHLKRDFIAGRTDGNNIYVWDLVSFQKLTNFEVINARNLTRISNSSFAVTSKETDEVILIDYALNKRKVVSKAEMKVAKIKKVSRRDVLLVGRDNTVKQLDLLRNVICN